MVNGILDYLWLVPALPLLGVVLNGAIALFAERPLSTTPRSGSAGTSHR